MIEHARYIAAICQPFIHFHFVAMKTQGCGEQPTVSHYSSH
jgi:hypothetical protein